MFVFGKIFLVPIGPKIAGPKYVVAEQGLRDPNDSRTNCKTRLPYMLSKDQKRCKPLEIKGMGTKRGIRIIGPGHRVPALRAPSPLPL